MYRKIQLLALYLLGLGVLYSYGQGDYARNITPTATGYIVTYDIPSGISEAVGREDLFYVPPGKTAVLSVLEQNFIEQRCDESPFASPVLEIADRVEPNVLPSMEWYPSDIVSQKTLRKYRGKGILPVGVNFIQYDAINKTSRLYNRISYEVKFTDNGRRNAISYNNNDGVRDTLRLGIIGMPVEISPTPIDKSFASPAGYLVITTTGLKSEIERFVLWKRIFGYDADVIARDNWTQESIKEAISDYYQSHRSLLYILFVGDNKDVPGYEKRYVYIPDNYNSSPYPIDYITDYPYACLDGDDDDMADVYRGRWATSDIDEVHAIIDKCIWYEEQPTLSEEFYKNAAHCAYFEHVSDLKRNRPGCENMRFVQTSEEIRRYMEGFHDISVSTSYWETAGMNGFYEVIGWGNKYPVEDDSKLLIKEDKNFSNFIDDINDGSLYALYRGHGDQKGLLCNHAEKEDFTLNKARKLRNGDYLPLFMSITCSSGDFSDRCFAQELLGNESGGAIAVFAATNTGFKYLDDFLATSIFNYAWPSPGFNPGYYGLDSISNDTVPNLQFGRILDEGLFKMNQIYSDAKTNRIGQYTNEIFHCFGDPSMMFHSTKPTEFDNLSLCPMPYVITVKLNGDEKAYMSFYDHSTGEVKRHYGNEYEYHNDNWQNASFAIYAPNKIPRVIRSCKYNDYGYPDYPRENIITGLENSGNGVIEVGYRIESDVRNASIVAVDLYNNREVASIKCTDTVGTVGLHVGSGVYAVALMIDGRPYDYKRILVPNN